MINEVDVENILGETGSTGDMHKYDNLFYLILIADTADKNDCTVFVCCVRPLLMVTNNMYTYYINKQQMENK